MKHWSAKLLFTLDHASAGSPVMEEKTLLVRAARGTDAWEMARVFGMGEAEEFERNGQLIRWNFEGILELRPLPDTSLVEVDSREHMPAEFDNAMLYARHRIENTRQEINCTPLSGILN